MLAQAQEMIVIKAMKGNMKDAIVAKLCSQCEDMYAGVMKSVQKESVRNLWDASWEPNIFGKQAIYNGLAQYYQSRVCNADKSVGEEIARLVFEIYLAFKRTVHILFFNFDWVETINHQEVFIDKTIQKRKLFEGGNYMRKYRHSSHKVNEKRPKTIGTKSLRCFLGT